MPSIDDSLPDLNTFGVRQPTRLGLPANRLRQVGDFAFGAVSPARIAGEPTNLPAA